MSPFTLSTRSAAFGERRDVLGMYSSASNRVKVKYVDPDRQPALAKEFACGRYGTVVVAAGDRHMEAQGDGEEGITNALVRVLKGQRTACFIQTHGERNLDSSDATVTTTSRSQLSQRELPNPERCPFCKRWKSRRTAPW